MRIMKIKNCKFSTPVGTLYCVGDADAITGIFYEANNIYGDAEPVALSNYPFSVLHSQISDYFNLNGALKLKYFSVPYKLSGTKHQLAVWNELSKIPYGCTVTYADIAKTVGSAPIAVGQAVGRNPVNIIVPCHRVIGSDGSLTGYGGGLERKRFLLGLEKYER